MSGSNAQPASTTPGTIPQPGTATPPAETPAVKVDDKVAAPAATEPSTKEAAPITEPKPAEPAKGDEAKDKEKAAADALTEATKKVADEQRAAWEKTRAEWQKQAREDKDFGGEKWDASKAVAKRAMDKFADPDLVTFLDETGLGDHPAMVRLMVRMGRAMGEDSITGQAAAPGSKASQPLHVSLYSTMNPKP